MTERVDYRAESPYITLCAACNLRTPRVPCTTIISDLLRGRKAVIA